MMVTTRSEHTRFRRLLWWRGDRPLTSHDAASRITAFVYGNILVLASLLALSPGDLLGVKAIAYVLGTGLSTFVAHVVAEVVGSSIHSPTDQTNEAKWQSLRHHFADALPIASSAIMPALLLTLALMGWIDPAIGLMLSIIVTVVRLSGLGWVVGRLRQRRASFRTFLIGMMLGVVCIVVAILKWWLTH
jgi:hypothetical protein